MFCSHCGQKIDDNARFCTNCGAPISQNSEASQKSAQNTAFSTPSPEAKSKLAAGLLGIFLGSLGIHNFYLGYTKRAVAQLLITVLTCGAGSIATGIWGLVEGVFYLVGHEGYKTDANGVNLVD